MPKGFTKWMMIAFIVIRGVLRLASVITGWCLWLVLRIPVATARLLMLKPHTALEDLIDYMPSYSVKDI